MYYAQGPAQYWRKWQAQDLTTPTAFSRSPSLVWEFYQYREPCNTRELMMTKEPNPAHIAIAECEARLAKQVRTLSAPDPKAKDAGIPVEQLPRCEVRDCNGLLRPHLVWFGETLDSDILTAVELDMCDLCLVVGTSSIVYPAAMFAPQVASRGVPVAEFNMEDTPATLSYRFHFEGPCGSTLLPALERHETETII
ncbi:NAD-dependent protein deacylase sirtuin-5, mitochondrial [Engraulis encrasicolus]|uniref:NAD-dependent protein deacylase sirtuin-5, mitochondrial n=1 Tax=Engraulis encrasicolus TaxID=184585 RepID=UPI002FD75767